MNLFLTQKNLTPRTVRNTFQHFEEFRNLEHQLQIDSLINFFVKTFSRTSELAKDLETDPLDNVVFDKKYKNVIALTEFGVKNGFEIC